MKRIHSFSPFSWTFFIVFISLLGSLLYYRMLRHKGQNAILPTALMTALLAYAVMALLGIYYGISRDVGAFYGMMLFALPSTLAAILMFLNAMVALSFDHKKIAATA
jgi:hypothetical protein